MMKTAVAAAFAAAALLGAPIVSATPDMCAGHADYADLPNGAGFGNTYITACGGDGGPDYGNNAVTPNNSPSSVPTGGSRTQSGTGGVVDSGTHDDNQNNNDEDGIQGHDNVRNSPLFVPGGVS